MTAPLIFITGSSGPALAPAPEWAFALQLASLGTALGAALALRAKARRPTVDTWQITATWATLGFAVGLRVIAVGLLF